MFFTHHFDPCFSECVASPTASVRILPQRGSLLSQMRQSRLALFDFGPELQGKALCNPICMHPIYYQIANPSPPMIICIYIYIHTCFFYIVSSCTTIV